MITGASAPQGPAGRAGGAAGRGQPADRRPARRGRRRPGPAGPGDGLIDGIPEPVVRESLGETRDALTIPPEAIAHAIASGVDQPADVDVNEIVVRPAAQA